MPKKFPSALDALQHVWGYPAFRSLQAQAIDHVVAGRDALVLMPTGGGKSLCFQIPALLREGVGIVVSPLIALMQDQVAALRELGLRAAFLNSTLDATEARAVQRAARQGELDLLYMAPERLLSESGQALLDDLRIALFAIDEAHCVSQWGHDFRPEYGQLSLLRERWPEVPRVALTATADEPTRHEIVQRLLHDGAEFVSSFDRPNIRYRVVEKRDGRAQLLQFIRSEHPHDCGVVYALSRNTVEEVAEMLAGHGLRALPYHAGLPAAIRTAHLRRFLDEDGIVMVATIAFGMGIDKPDVRFVAHLDMPKSIEGYFQETGRAGRDGLPATAWMAYGLADVVQQRRLIDLSDADDAYKRLSTAKLDAMLALAEAADCRRVRLLGYFGEASAPCGNCDNCLNPPQLIDATEAAQKLLSTIYRCRQASGTSFAASHLIDVLRGKRTEKTERHGHHALSTFGIGADLSETDWRLLLRQLVAQRLVEVDAAHFNVLHLTDASRAVLKGAQRIHLKHREPGAERRRRSTNGSTTSTGTRPTMQAMSSADAELFAHLRTWRAATAKEHGVPAFVVFPDATLQAIALARPDSLDALRGISGVGDKKRDTYGAALLEVIAQASEMG
ncbi:ATP-dependent DNA helicase RecQ [Thiomonas arsenitoxydans]|uniref:DNA helicase RecQ n=1 Tax=Thiomonas arsenitoxydans (strain DSM 22701 / CIP 110005 / 3As) TaxID=426114 RepID=D6CV23_THIA3|nr:DNA helicase RecQ [Thiomonas arsenitoxydans]CQR45327.1 ATP-dependent DNA helicase RecQ [Thiomonas sp. CB3]CAZ89142.1 ATP-dependent DNA helicase recQ [Thiomonas arsenitoxydans]CQR36714.1 ATP-dependent DNA helicase RecQ [Thiomonas arsenitoxydans]CQR36718.1 ATP-dependent DNA helicase RecQ [Thiomonas arsenitoxydans]CQR37144.1 ATP-dependent DNA helicase RecQ [Thiomonas arsenitoxydans]